MIHYVAHVSVLKKLFDVLLPQNVTILEMSKEYWILVRVALLFNLGNSSDAFLLLQAQQIGVSPAFVPLTVVVMNITYFLSAYPVGLLSDRIGRLGLLVGGFLLYALTYLGFAFTSSSWQIWVLFALYGLYQGMNKGIFSAMVAEKYQQICVVLLLGLLIWLLV